MECDCGQIKQKWSKNKFTFGRVSEKRKTLFLGLHKWKKRVYIIRTAYTKVHDW